MALAVVRILFSQAETDSTNRYQTPDYEKIHLDMRYKPLSIYITYIAIPPPQKKKNSQKAFPDPCSLAAPHIVAPPLGDQHHPPPKETRQEGETSN